MSFLLNFDKSGINHTYKKGFLSSSLTFIIHTAIFIYAYKGIEIIEKQLESWKHCRFLALNCHKCFPEWNFTHFLSSTFLQFYIFIQKKYHINSFEILSFICQQATQSRLSGTNMEAFFKEEKFISKWKAEHVLNEMLCHWHSI